jgi:hypothetical protein
VSAPVHEHTLCDLGQHYKRRINGIWLCINCTAFCQDGCGRQVAVQGASCIRCANRPEVSRVKLYLEA